MRCPTRSSTAQQRITLPEKILQCNFNAKRISQLISESIIFIEKNSGSKQGFFPNMKYCDFPLSEYFSNKKTLKNVNRDYSM